MEPLRKCRKCGVEAHTTDGLGLFQKCVNARHGRNNLCSVCLSKRNRGVAKDNWIRLFELKGSQCAHCFVGDYHPSVYELHHVDPSDKEHSLGRILHAKNWERIEKEAAKCILLCANCHRTLHSLEREQGYAEIN